MTKASVFTTDQYDSSGGLRHLLGIDGLKKETLEEIFNTADSLLELDGRTVKKVPVLRGKTIVLLFFEPSTRTRTTFELAAKRLSADVITINLASSATSKGESLLDTVNTLVSMHADMFVIRHADGGAVHLIANQVADRISVLNAGDGCHSHPTQALLDMYTIRQVKADFSTLKVAIVGDLVHSRVARSEIQALHLLGTRDIRAVGPATLVPDLMHSLGVRVCHRLEEGLEGVDVVVTLRLQRERMSSAFLPSESEYFEHYGLTLEKLKLTAPDCIVMHPGPINRGVEIDSAVADSKHSLISRQVTNGIAVRMAVMALMNPGNRPGNAS